MKQKRPHAHYGGSSKWNPFSNNPWQKRTCHKNKECRCRRWPLVLQEQPQQSLHPHQKSPSACTTLKLGGTRRGLSSNSTYLQPLITWALTNHYLIGPSARIVPKPGNSRQFQSSRRKVNEEWAFTQREMTFGQKVKTIGSRPAPKRYMPGAGATQDKEQYGIILCLKGFCETCSSSRGAFVCHWCSDREESALTGAISAAIQLS